MKLRSFTLIFIFGLFIFLLPSFAEAACGLSCEDTGTNCFWGPPYPWDPPDPNQRSGVERIGTIQDIGKTDYLTGTSYCSRSNGKCKESGFPSGSNGQVCVAHDQAWDWGACNDCSKSGKWDASDPDSGDGPACIQCDGKKENRILGDNSSVGDVCNDNFPAGDTQCESACGADSQCDEKTYGSNVSVSGGTCNYCVFTASKPDLIITDIWPDGSTIKYTVKNQGNASAGSSSSYLYVDGSQKTSDSVSSLSAGASSNESFSYTWTCSGTSDTIKVCADGGSAVSESNEGNNCREETWDCPLPDFRITSIWFEADKKVNYSIYNYGTVTAGASQSYLYVNGSHKASDSVSSLNANNGRDEYFSGWTCTAGQNYSIEVCADKAGPSEAAASGGGDVAESNETNNCRTETLTCPAAECAGTLSVSITGAGSCNVTARIYPSSGCTVELYRILENGGERWSGALDGDNTITRTRTVGVGSYDYDLEFYTDGWRWQDDDRNNSCPEEVCNCTGWSNQSCGYSICDAYHMGQTRTCTPSGCDPGDGYGEFRCICSESCCTSWSNQGCGAGGCAATEMYKTRTCGSDCSYSTSQCVSDPSCGGEVTINPPEVFTMAIGEEKISEDPNHPGKYRAILDGLLNSLGYEPAACSNCKCIVWFGWGTSGTEGVSSSYGNSNTPIEVSSTGHFYYTADNLDPGTTFKFEAFAKNGGSW